jgi:ABC-2 type transport system ATP-binding protein
MSLGKFTESPVTPAAGGLATLAGRPQISDEAVVKCIGLSKVFKDFWMRNKVRSVDNIDFEIRKGEVFGLLGPNGSGKSTTIKMILGLLNPTAGRVLVFNRRPDEVETKRHIGYLPEESYLYKFLNARETLDYYAKLFNLDSSQRSRRIDSLLEMVGLDAVQSRPVGQYSKGMQRRIGLAQALINDPDFLILDEPTTGLDPIGTRQTKDIIIELARKGKTILLCSHLLSDVEDVCDRVAIMFGGKIRAMGTVDELLTRYDQTTLQTPPLDAQTIQEVEAVLARHGKHIERVDHPRQKLEALFLEIVQRAHAEGASTAGAKNSGKIAQFLVDKNAATGDQVIADLIAPVPTQGEVRENAAAQGASDRRQEAKAAQNAAEDRLISELVATPKAPEPVKEPQAKPDEVADLSVIDSLINDDKKKPS